MPETDLLATIRGEFVGNHKVWLGQAFGSVLEHPDRYKVPGGYRVASDRCPETFAFGDDVIAPALALIDRPLTVFEAKGVGQYGGHDVVAKADQMIGAHLIETKTTLGTFDFDKYAESCQWRFMADIFQVPHVMYHVFCLDEDVRNDVIRLKSIETFELYPYAAMRGELEHLVRDFDGYIDMRELRPVLDARQLAAVGAL